MARTHIDASEAATALDKAIAEAREADDGRVDGLVAAARILRDLEAPLDEETQLPGAIYEETRAPRTVPDDDHKRWSATVIGAVNVVAESKKLEMESMAKLARVSIPDGMEIEPMDGRRVHLVPVKYEGRWVTAIVLAGLDINTDEVGMSPVQPDEEVAATIALMLDDKMASQIEVDGEVIKDRSTGRVQGKAKPAIGTGGVLR